MNGHSHSSWKWCAQQVLAWAVTCTYVSGCATPRKSPLPNQVPAASSAAITTPAAMPAQTAATEPSSIRLVAAAMQEGEKRQTQPAPTFVPLDLPQPPQQPASVEALGPPAESVQPSTSGSLAIDLVSALRLANGNNLQVAIAREQIEQAWSALSAARAMWLPSIRGGMNYNRHDGPIQTVQGPVIPISRSAFFSGLGAGSVGAGSPMLPGIYAYFETADAIFGPLAAQQSAMAARHAAQATTNDMLLQVCSAYLELARASEERVIATETRRNANQLHQLTRTYAESGQGLISDADRTAVELALRESEQARSREGVQVASARLAQLLRLNPTVELTPIPDVLLPIEVVSSLAPAGELVAQGLSFRPEIGENRHLVAQAVARMRREQYAILLPSVLVGASYGAFGGGVNQSIAGTGGRFDADAIAYWELRNLGVGDAAARSQSRSVTRQANATRLASLDLVAREVVEAHAQVQNRRIQIEKTRQAVEAAEASHARNLDRIHQGQGLPIEALQSVQALALARREYLRAVIDFNLAQFSLFRAIGWPTNLPAGLAPMHVEMPAPPLAAAAAN